MQVSAQTVRNVGSLAWDRDHNKSRLEEGRECQVGINQQQVRILLIWAWIGDLSRYRAQVADALTVIVNVTGRQPLSGSRQTVRTFRGNHCRR